MRPTPLSLELRVLFAGFLLLLGAAPAWSQALLPAPHGYDFLTLTTIESYRKAEAKMLFTPAFQGKAELPLADGDIVRLTTNDIGKISQNTLLVNQQLSALTTAGWELLQVYAVAPVSGAGYNPPITRYLFRKAKP